jgi:beta-mannosidase
MDDVLVSPIEKEDQLHVYLVSDRLKAVKGTLTIEVEKMDGTIVNRISKVANAEANSSHDALNIPIHDLLKGSPRKDVFLHVMFKADKTYENNYCLDVPKNMNFPKATIQSTVKDIQGGVEITLTADRFARGVFMSIPGHDYFFEDNYIDLLPGRPKTIHVDTPMTSAQVRNQLKIVSLSDI